METCCTICGFCGPKTADGYCKNIVTGPHMTMYGKRKRSMVLNPDYEVQMPDQAFETYNENEGNSVQPSYKDEHGQVFVGRYDPNKSFVKGRTTADIEHAENKHIHKLACKCVICTIGGIVLIDEDGNPTGNTASDPGGVGDSFEMPHENNLFHLDAKRIYEGLDNYIETNGTGNGEVIDPELAEILLKKLGRSILYPKPSFEHGHRPCVKCNTKDHKRMGLTGDKPVTHEDRSLVKVDTKIPNTCECGICGKCENGKTIFKVTHEAVMPYKAFVKSSDYRMHSIPSAKGTKDEIESFNQQLYGTLSKTGKRRIKTDTGHESMTYPDIGIDNSCIGNNGAGNHRRLAHNVKIDIVGNKLIFGEQDAFECFCQTSDDPFFRGIKNLRDQNDQNQTHIDFIKKSLQKHPELLTEHFGADVKEVTFLLKDDDGLMQRHTMHVSDSDTPMSVPWRLKTMAGLPLWMQSKTVVEILDSEYRPFGPKPEWDNSKAHIGMPYIDMETGIPMRSRTDKKYLARLKVEKSFEERCPSNGLATDNQRFNIFGPHGIVLPDWISYRFAWNNAEKLGYGKLSKTTPQKVEDVKQHLAQEIKFHEHMKTHTLPFKTEWCDECSAFYHHQEYFEGEDRVDEEMDRIEIFNDNQVIEHPQKIVFDEKGMIVNRRPIYIAIVGSAKERQLSFAIKGEVEKRITEAITDLINQHGEELVIVSGGAIGVDTYAIDIAESLGVKTLMHKPDVQLDNLELQGDWDPVSRTYKNKRHIPMPQWKDGKYRHDLGRVEVGYRTRNLRIASKAQYVIVVAIQPGIGMCAPTEWQGPRKGLARIVRCIHCNGEHYTTAGCWTAMMAKVKHGATVETIEIPDGGVDTHTKCWNASWAGTCKACNKRWKEGDEIFWEGTPKGVPNITCSDKE